MSSFSAPVASSTPFNNGAGISDRINYLSQGNSAPANIQQPRLNQYVPQVSSSMPQVSSSMPQVSSSMPQVSRSFPQPRPQYNQPSSYPRTAISSQPTRLKPVEPSISTKSDTGGFFSNLFGSSKTAPVSYSSPMASQQFQQSRTAPSSFISSSASINPKTLNMSNKVKFVSDYGLKIVTGIVLLIAFIFIMYSLYTLFKISWRQLDIGLMSIGGVKGEMEDFVIQQPLAPINNTMSTLDGTDINKEIVKGYTLLDLDENDNINGYDVTPVTTTIPAPVIGLGSSNPIFMYGNNNCRPECCPSIYSCSGGCICETKKQVRFLEQRGNNNSSPQSP